MYKPYIIAEIGINHMGDIDLAKELIRQAAINGADAVKFQLYDVDKVLSDRPDLIEEVRPTMLDQQQYISLSKFAKIEGVECSASVFDTIRLDWLIQTDPAFFKIASRTMRDNVQLATDIIKHADKLKKSVYISSGMKDRMELIDTEFAKVWGAYNSKYMANTGFLLCVSKYPSEYHDYNMNGGFYNRDDPWSHVGISGHTPGIETALYAIAHGARVVEKHFTLNKALPGPDHKCSITPPELLELRKYGDYLAKIRWIQEDLDKN